MSQKLYKLFHKSKFVLFFRKKLHFELNFFFYMPQVDVTLFLSIIVSVVKSSSVFYCFFIVYLFYPFISKIKIIFNFFSKIKQIKNIIF